MNFQKGTSILQDNAGFFFSFLYYVGFKAQLSGRWITTNESVLSVDMRTGIAEAVGPGSTEGTWYHLFVRFVSVFLKKSYVYHILLYTLLSNPQTVPCWQYYLKVQIWIYGQQWQCRLGTLCPWLLQLKFWQMFLSQQKDITSLWISGL